MNFVEVQAFCSVLFFVIFVKCDSYLDAASDPGEKIYETTTSKYPTATWSALNYEKKKKTMMDMWKLYLFKPSPFLKPPFTDGEIGASIAGIEDSLAVSGRRRGKAKSQQNKQRDDLDKILEDALHKYIKSSNLTDQFGMITVEMFADVLRKITAAKKHPMPIFEESKDTYRKFLDDNLLPKKPEITTQVGIIEKQYQRRLQKSWKVTRFSKSTLPPHGEEFMSSTEKSTEPTVRNELIQSRDNANDLDFAFSNEVSKNSEKEEIPESTTLLPSTTQKVSTPKIIKISRGTKKYRDTIPKTFENEEKTLQLSVAETNYYQRTDSKRGQSNRITELNFSAIPGEPGVDYPIFSKPPLTGFRCPLSVRNGSRMVADPKTRCQVFYMCADDSPPTPMLCPNGTMFNEKVFVCDWWFNVDC